MKSVGIERRLWLLLLAPMLLIVLTGGWLDYRAAGGVAAQQDRQLLRLAPLLADSVMPAPGTGLANTAPSPQMLLAPLLAEFLQREDALASFAVADMLGNLVAGEPWLIFSVPATQDAEFHSEEHNGVIFRVMAQRVNTPAGEYVIYLADGSDARQRWLGNLLLRVVAPNALLMIAAAVVLRIGVRLALQPLLQLTRQIEARQPGDLSPIDERHIPQEVRPLVSALNHLLARMDEQADHQRRFVADAAHQLRTPLAALQAQVEAWTQVVLQAPAAHRPAHLSALTPVPAPVPALHQRLAHPVASDTAHPDLTEQHPGALTLTAAQLLRFREATRRTTLLANQLLTLSRADAVSVNPADVQRIDLQDLCENVLESRLDDAIAAGIDLGLEVEHVHIAGHAWLLRELLANLVDNALRYAPPSGTHVTLRCGWLADHAPFMEIEDNGPGIAADHRERALHRFYRCPGTVREGSGLGLAIAAEIALRHRSHVELLDGANGRGLRVRMRFAAPLDEGPQALVDQLVPPWT
jgi:two-component system, OmpR family, sensor histidine kinase TctE